MWEKLKSSGIDLSLNYNHMINNDAWLTGMANFTYATSEFTAYEEPDYSATPWKSKLGTSLNQNFGYVAERLFADEEDIRNSPSQFGNYMAGDIKYKDIPNADGVCDGVIDANDRVYTGHPTVPEIVYGFGPSFQYKKWDFFFLFSRSSPYVYCCRGYSSFWYGWIAKCSEIYCE